MILTSNDNTNILIIETLDQIEIRIGLTLMDY
jgi:hypothetical protein